MGWKDIVGDTLRNAAPKLAKGLLGEIPVIGPMAVALGGDAIDAAIGGMIAKAFNVEATPEAVKTAIQAAPSDVAVAKLQAVETEAVGKWPALAQIITAQETGDTERLKAMITDVMDARARDLEVRKAPAGANARANVMLAGAFVTLVTIIIGVLLFRSSIPDGIAAILNTACGSLLTLIGMAFNFEFGSSRGSSEKSDSQTSMMTTLLSKK